MPSVAEVRSFAVPDWLVGREADGALAELPSTLHTSRVAFVLGHWSLVQRQGVLSTTVDAPSCCKAHEGRERGFGFMSNCTAQAIFGLISSENKRCLLELGKYRNHTS